jgi:hypothetical protein
LTTSLKDEPAVMRVLRNPGGALRWRLHSDVRMQCSWNSDSVDHRGSPSSAPAHSEDGPKPGACTTTHTVPRPSHWWQRHSR